jgi:hypothetical protein
MVGLEELAAEAVTAGRARLDSKRAPTPVSSSLFHDISLPFPRALTVNRS